MTGGQRANYYKIIATLDENNRCIICNLKNVDW